MSTEEKKPSYKTTPVTLKEAQYLFITYAILLVLLLILIVLYAGLIANKEIDQDM